jgi:hypothetical protein
MILLYRGVEISSYKISILKVNFVMDIDRVTTNLLVRAESTFKDESKGVEKDRTFYTPLLEWTLSYPRVLFDGGTELR